MHIAFHRYKIIFRPIYTIYYSPLINGFRLLKELMMGALILKQVFFFSVKLQQQHDPSSALIKSFIRIALHNSKTTKKKYIELDTNYMYNSRSKAGKKF